MKGIVDTILENIANEKVSVDTGTRDLRGDAYGKNPEGDVELDSGWTNTIGEAGRDAKIYGPGHIAHIKKAGRNASISGEYEFGSIEQAKTAYLGKINLATLGKATLGKKVSENFTKDISIDMLVVDENTDINHLDIVGNIGVYMHNKDANIRTITRKPQKGNVVIQNGNAYTMPGIPSVDRELATYEEVLDLMEDDIDDKSKLKGYSMKKKRADGNYGINTLNGSIIHVPKLQVDADNVEELYEAFGMTDWKD